MSNNFDKKLITSKDVSRLDANSASLGIPSGYLMESAGLQATNKIYEQYHLNSNSSVVIMCGIGNNGGDGLCIARHLASRGVFVNVILLGDPIHIRTEETRLNWNLVSTLSMKIQPYQIRDPKQLEDLSKKECFKSADIIIDALLGTGIRGKIREPISTAIDIINQNDKPKISIDVPSGMDPDTGKIIDKAVNCDLCITFHAKKHGFSNINTYVAPIGIPIDADVFVGDGDLRQAIKKRNRNIHKGQYGKLLIIGGSSSYSGAPTLAAMSALELGIDLCICFVPRGIGNVIRSFSPNLIVQEGVAENLSINDVEKAKNLSKWADCVLVGPGLGKASGTFEFFKSFIEWILEEKVPCVVDADGIKFLGKILHEKKLNLTHSNLVLTPHAAELRSIIQFKKLPEYNDFEARTQTLITLLQKIKGVFLIKGVYDYIIEISGKKNIKNKYKINRTGCPEMSVGGTGDVLAGLVSALISLGNDTFSSACVAAYINGLVGESAKESYGPRIHATDLIRNLKSFLISKNL
ncbi:MAG: NAD(P)H-hydrate dehydratase [Promethearchaeota archaeon]